MDEAERTAARLERLAREIKTDSEKLKRYLERKRLKRREKWIKELREEMRKDRDALHKIIHGERKGECQTPKIPSWLRFLCRR